MNNGQNTLIIGGTRTGKTTAFFIPSLLKNDDSVLVFDKYGEKYKETAEYRKKFSTVFQFDYIEDAKKYEHYESKIPMIFESIRAEKKPFSMYLSLPPFFSNTEHYFSDVFFALVSESMQLKNPVSFLLDDFQMLEYLAFEYLLKKQVVCKNAITITISCQSFFQLEAIYGQSSTLFDSFDTIIDTFLFPSPSPDNKKNGLLEILKRQNYKYIKELKTILEPSNILKIKKHTSLVICKNCRPKLIETPYYYKNKREAST